VDVKLAILAGIMGVIAYFGSRKPDSSVPRDRGAGN
jgi:hypothetical protein